MSGTPVLFRIDTSGPFKGDVTAVFPTIPGSPGYLTCYAHVGQHGSCGMNWLYERCRRPATPAEYAKLHAELVAIGYDDLIVCRRIRPGHWKAYHQHARTMARERHHFDRRLDVVAGRLP